jgi:outer membrane protein OmpA-like peptidoglycan-associated protein
LKKIQQRLDDTLHTTTPSGLMGKALGYLHNQWPNLIGFTKNGNYPIDNNAAENAIRPFVIGRKNWLFANSTKGAKASANLYFDGDKLTEASQEALNRILASAEGAYVAVIGHTSTVALSEDKVGLNGWESFWQMIGGSEADDKEDALKRSNFRLKYVYDYIKAQLHDVKLYSENRLDRDPIATEATQAGKAMNERVEVLVLR